MNMIKHSIPVIGTMVLMALVSCQREGDRTVAPNPSYDPETNSVRTEFVLNVSTATGKDTKTTAKFAQAGENPEFLGMTDVHLLTYELSHSNADHGTFFFSPIRELKPVQPNRDYNLGTLFAAGAVTSEKSSRTLELALPLGTNAVLLYGKAAKTESDDLQGKVAISGKSDDLTSLTFALQPRLESKAAFDAGTFFLSRMISSFLTAGLVDESSFYKPATGATNRSYAFWWPTPSEADAEELPANPTDQQAATVNGTDYVFYAGELSWKQLGTMYRYQIDGDDATNPNLVVKTSAPGDKAVYMDFAALNEVLGNAYYSLVDIRENTTSGLKELRAGSAQAVLSIMQDLYSIVERAKLADPTTWSEKAAQLLAVQIDERMIGDGKDGKYYGFFQFKNGVLDFARDANGAFDIAYLKKAIEQNCSSSDWSANSSVVLANLNEEYFYSEGKTPGFPVNVGLPFGAAIMVCNVDAGIDKVDQFRYTEDIPAYGFGTATFPIANYRYPAELVYFGNSSIRTSNQTKKAGDYPSSVDAWDSEDKWTGWSPNAKVASDTRSVAMTNNINYGTALLASSVKFSDDVVNNGYLLDNNAALHSGEDDLKVSITGNNNSSPFKITGIVVGGQCDKVGWNYIRMPDAGVYEDSGYDTTNEKFYGFTYEKDPFDKMIYDKVLTDYYVGQTTAPIYTLVWDNYDPEKKASEQSDVYVGIEVLNEGDDFWGEMNLIRHGGTFYLLGKLDLSVAVATARGNNASAFTSLDRKYYCYPPYNPVTGETINAPRVFMQDYLTKANLILGTDALKHAYMTVPDLRSSQISLGVSIDMNWTPGLAFDVNMGWLD